MYALLVEDVGLVWRKRERADKSLLECQTCGGDGVIVDVRLEFEI